MIIIIAPHLMYPPHNGGDIYIERLGCYLSKYRDIVCILGENALTYYETGTLINQYPFINKSRTKTSAAIRALIFRNHYLIEKFLTKSYRENAKKLIRDHPDATIIYSFIVTTQLNLTAKRAVVITQNDEVEIYQKQKQTTNNFFQKATAELSEKWLLNFLQRGKDKYTFAHITQADQFAYEKMMPGHQSIIIPPGVDVYGFPKIESWNGKIKLLYCGSLSVKMNLDALLYFKETFWPLIKEYFEEDVEMTVAGSKPTGSIKKLCADENWELCPDVSDEDLWRLYNRSTFGVLPFPYTAGAKIKLLNNLAAGLPVLATTNMKILPDQDFYPNLYSDEPVEWLFHIQKFQEIGMDRAKRIACQEYASQYSWDKIMAKVSEDLTKLGI